MPQGFDDSYKPANPFAAAFASVPTPWRDDAAPSHPLSDWKPTARGDATALLPYIDHDLAGEEEQSNPVAEGLGWADRTHLGAEAMINGGTKVSELGEHAHHLLAGKLSGGKAAFQAVAPIAAGLSLVGGGLDLWEGWEQWKSGKKEDGAFKMTEGGANVVSGVSGFAALGGSTAAATTSVVTGSAALGLAAGHYGDKKAEELGWYRDEYGNPERVSESAADSGMKVNKIVAKHGHPYLAAALGGVSTVYNAAANVPDTIAAAAVGAGHDIGTAAANHHRANHYANYDVNVDGGAQSLADYDDKQRAAVQAAGKRQLDARRRAFWQSMEDDQ